MGLLLREGKRRDEMVELYEGTLEGWRVCLRFEEEELLVSNIRDRGVMLFEKEEGKDGVHLIREEVA